MSIEKPYQPSEEEIQKAEEPITEEQEKSSEEREATLQAGQELSRDESVESLEQRELILKNEIAEGVSELDENIGNIESLAEDENLTPTLRDKLLSSIDTISNKIKKRFMIHLGGTALLGGIVGLQEYLINTKQTSIQEGSILGDANEVVLAGLALYASIKGIQFVGHKIREFSVKREINKGTVRGASDAASYLINEGEDYAGVDKNTLDVSYPEHLKLHKEAHDIFNEEDINPHWKEYSVIGGKRHHMRWKESMRRIRTESSKLLTQKQ